MRTDIEVILNALSKEREDLHQQLMQIDRIINRVKKGTYEAREAVQIKEQPKPQQLKVAPVPAPNRSVSPSLDMKLQVLKAMDILGCAVNLKQIQTEFHALTGSKIIIRDIVRSLQKANILKLMRDKQATRGYLWVKTDWIDNGILAEKHRPEGFDLLYNAEDFVFE